DTAFAGEDFVDASGDVVFAPNQLNQTLVVVVNGDKTIESDEQFLVNLSVPSDATFTPTLDDTQAVGTILSDDTGFRITDVNKVELEAGSPNQNYVFNVSIVGAKLTPSTSSLQSDVDAVTTTLSLGNVADFPVAVPFTILVDSEQMQVTAVNAGTNEFTVVRGINGTVAATHAASATVNRAFVVNYSIVDGSATAGLDYVAPAGPFPIALAFVPGPNGELPAGTTITVEVNGDNLVESNETFTVDLTSTDLPDFEFGKSQGIGTIFNDDLGFNISSPLPATPEGNAAVVTFTVSLQQRVYVAAADAMGTPTQATITANVSTNDGTAISGSSGDYTTVSQAVTFAGATTTAQVVVPVHPPPDQWRVFTDPGTGDIVVNFSAGGGAEVLVVQLPANTVFEIRGDRDGVYVSNVLFGDVPPADAIADDLFIVDFTTGLNPIPAGGMTVHGGFENGADAVEFRNGTTFGLVTYDSFGPGSGRVTFDGMFVDYDGLEPVVDKTFATNRVFNAPVNGSDDILLSSSDGSTTIKSATGLAAPTFESVTFSSEIGITTNLVVNGGTGNNNIVISGGEVTYPLSLTVNAGNGNDTIDLTGWSLTSTVLGEGGNDSITGGAAADSIDGAGGEGNDTLNGGIGDDSIVAGGGDDLVNGGDGKDTIQGNDGVDTINGGAGDDDIDGGAGSETVDGGLGNDTVSGGEGDDTVLGNDGDDVLNGGNGADSLDGGFGDDTMSGDAGNDIINGQNGSLDVFMYTDPTNSNINFTLTASAFMTPTETDTLTNTERAKIVAGNGNNQIDASLFTGSVTMDGAGGNDTLLGGTGSDSIIGGLGNDTASGGNGNDTIEGGDGNDTLSGDAGDDSITGDVGTDSISGGAGNDFADGGAGNDVLTGSSGIDTLDGGDNDDTISGGDDGDSLLGGAGQDSITGDNGDDTIDAGDGDDTAFGNDGNDFVGGSTGDDTLQGNLGDDSVNGMEGEDTLDGNAGIDTLFGGEGDDSLISTDGNDELLGQGGSFDTFTFEGDAVLGDIFTITRTGNGFTPPTGIGLARLNQGMEFTTIVLGVEIFTLNLNGGNDLVTLGDLNGVLDLTVLNINGGDGNDTIDGSLSTSTTVAINTNMGLGDDSVRGGAAADTIFGDAGKDTIIGNAGDDSMVGGDGDDSLNGSGGVDTINGGVGNDSILGGSGNDSLIGLDGNDTILGQAGNDTIDGGLGNDFLDGGYGNSVTAETGADSIIGGWGNDKIAGRGGNDTLWGDSPTDLAATGLDTILGGDGNDKVYAGNGNDLVQAGNGNDFINGGAGNDFLLGGSGNDSILGGSGNDTLVGEDGDDTLNGQGGTDTVVGGRGLGTDTHSVGDKRTGETINELFKITTARPSIFSELNF
ncbi:MAG: Hemolysin-type calcium-binding protein, partial [Planctomycetota bacterium]